MNDSQATASQAARTLLLRPEDLRPHPAYNAPTSENLIIRLTNSIKKYGLLQPIAVRATSAEEKDACYEIIDGHRRYRAALLAGLAQIPCRLLPPDDPLCVKMSLILTLKSQRPHFLEQAEFFQNLIESHGMKQEEIARHLGFSQSAIANKLRLLQLDTPLRQRLRQAKLTERHARSLLRVPAEDRKTMLDLFIQKEASVATAERLVDCYLSVKVARPQARDPGAMHATPEAVQPSLDPISSSFAADASSPKAASNPDAVPPPPAAYKPQVPPTAAQSQVPFPSYPQAHLRPITPSKFAIRDLRPLFNSINRTLDIFRKTGTAVECEHREEDQGTLILIRIPKQFP